MTEKEKLIEMILQNEAIQRYKRIENIINNNQQIKEKINQLKMIQKQITNAKQIGKKQAISTFESQYQTLYNEIIEYPLMSDYLALQSDINEMLQSIKTIIEDGIKKDFE